MRERGLDISRHRTRALTEPLVRDADLVLGMTRDHVAAAVAHAGDARGRAFLVGELPRLGETVGRRRPEEPVRSWAARAVAARPTSLVGRADEEIGDPVGGSWDVYRATATRLDAALARVADLVAGERA
jgi:protein-tyrosine phosphatase